MRKREVLQQYGRILQADNCFTHWQEVWGTLCTHPLNLALLVKQLTKVEVLKVAILIRILLLLLLPLYAGGVTLSN